MGWLADRLQHLLKERHLSIQRVATDLKMERAYLSLLVHGRVPSEELTRKLAAYFGENPEEWAFRTKAEPVLKEFREKYPNMMPRYARNLTEDGPGPEAFATSAYLEFNSPKGVPERQVVQFLPVKTIERQAQETLRLFAHKLGLDMSELEFPLDAELLAREVFDLDVHYDSEGVLDQIDQTLLGCLYPEGMESPWGRDRLIVVNAARRFQSVTDGFTILHEAGHFVFHTPLDKLSSFVGEAEYCRNGERDGGVKAKTPPREWQASRFASEVLIPKDEVAKVLRGLRPPAPVNLYVYGSDFRRHFGVSQAAMEKRLFDLGYQCAFGRYAYANPLGVGKA